MTDPHIDQAIDRAVREMVNVDSLSDVRAQVLDQLERPERRLFTWPRLGLAGATGLLILFALARGPHPALAPEVVSTPGPAASPVLVPFAPPRVGTGPVAHVRPGRGADRRVTATVAVETPATIPALDEIAPLVVPAPEPADIEPDAVIIAPLGAIPDVRVDPLLFPPGSRD